MNTQLLFSPLTDATVIDLALDTAIGEGFALSYNRESAVRYSLLRQAARQRGSGMAIPPWVVSVDSIRGVCDHGTEGLLR